MSLEGKVGIIAGQSGRDGESQSTGSLDAVRSGTWCIDLRSLQQTRDPGFNLILGLAPRESTLPLQDFLERVHQGCLAEVESHWRSLINEGQGYTLECKVIRPDGDVRWVRDRGEVVYGVDGTVKYATGTVTDITPLKQVEQEFGRRQLESALDALDTGVIVFDALDNIAFINASAATLHGYAGVEEARRALSAGPPAQNGLRLYDREGVELAYQDWPISRARRREPFSKELLTFVSENRERRWDVIVSGTIVWHEASERGIFVVSQRAASKTSSAASLPGHSADWWRGVTEAIPHAAWHADNDGNLEYLNGRAQEYIGQASGDVWRGSTDEVVHPGDISEVKRSWYKAVASGREYQMEARLRRGSDGAWRRHLLRAAPVRNSSGGPPGWIGVATETESSGATVMNLTDGEMNRRRNDFLAILGHELRNPLAALRHGLQLLREGGLGPEEQDEAQGMMERQVTRITNLVDDLLDLTRITQGAINLRPKRVELAGIIKNVEGAIAADMVRMGHRYSCTIRPPGLAVKADPIRLEQILTNVMSNAIKFTRPGGRVRLEAKSDDSKACVCIHDSGVGLSEEQLSGIFEPFAQVKVGQGGLGIGLTLALRLARMHGGDVTAKSQGEGRGSTFTVSLPLAEHGQPVRRAYVAGGLGGAGDADRALRVMLVEDNDAAAWGLSSILKRKGYTVETVADGGEALGQFGGFRPHVVLLDIGLPDMDGFEVISRLRSDPVSKGLRVAAITGYGDGATADRIAEAGFDAHFLKPINTDDLVEQLARWAQLVADS